MTNWRLNKKSWIVGAAFIGRSTVILWLLNVQCTCKDLKLIFRRPSNAGESNSLNWGGLGVKLAFLAIKLEQLSALQLYLPSLESFGVFWNFLILLELSVIFWNHLDSLRIFWIILKSFGFFWIPLESFGIFRIISESLGFFWYLSFRICGIFWILWLSLQAVSAGCLCRLSLQALSTVESFEYSGIL